MTDNTDSNPQVEVYIRTCNGLREVFAHRADAETVWRREGGTLETARVQGHLPALEYARERTKKRAEVAGYERAVKYLTSALLAKCATTPGRHVTEEWLRARIDLFDTSDFDAARATLESQSKEIERLKSAEASYRAVFSDQERMLKNQQAKIASLTEAIGRANVGDLRESECRECSNLRGYEELFEVLGSARDLVSFTRYDMESTPDRPLADLVVIARRLVDGLAASEDHPTSQGKAATDFLRPDRKVPRRVKSHGSPKPTACFSGGRPLPKVLITDAAPKETRPECEEPLPRSEIPEGIVIDPCTYGWCAVVEGSAGSWNTAIRAARNLLGLSLPAPTPKTDEA